MPFVANTPESRLERADSKNPSATCRGITATGRPCRRAISRLQVRLPNASLPLASHQRLARLPHPPDLCDEGLYCWQHKDQAAQSARSSPGPRVSTTRILEERSSLDTLADRLGLVELQEKQHAQEMGHREANRHARGARRTVARGPKSRQSKQTTTQLKCCFCFSVPIEEVQQLVRSRPRPQPVQQPVSAPVPNQQKGLRQHAQTQQQPSPTTVAGSPSRNSERSVKSSASRTAQLKTLIPDSLDSTTASALMVELSRPFVDSEDAGYIYMFWLTLASESKAPPVEAARSLLAPPLSPAAGRARGSSDAVSAFSGRERQTMLLKIGRATNVHRRMNQWQRQCGRNIELLRYYPYVSSSSPPSLSTPVGGRASTARVTPHCHRVERLVHIELTGMGLKADTAACGACGQEHREWFEVKASREGIRRVDEVIRRWVAWDVAMS